MKTFAFLLLLFSSSSYALSIKPNTCYIKWNSSKEKTQDLENYQNAKSKDGYVSTRLGNEQIAIGIQIDNNTFAAYIGKSKIGEKFIKDKKAQGYNKYLLGPEALNELTVTELMMLLQGFDETSCDHFKSERDSSRF